MEPEYDLKVMSEGQSLNRLSANILMGVGEIISKTKPHLVLVHGDTATTLAASLAAYYAKIDIAHIEAGLRTDNLYSPWPEEANRRLVSVLARYNFAPTEQSKQNLLTENISKANIFIYRKYCYRCLAICTKKAGKRR